MKQDEVFLRAIQKHLAENGMQCDLGAFSGVYYLEFKGCVIISYPGGDELIVVDSISHKSNLCVNDPDLYDKITTAIYEEVVVFIVDFQHQQNLLKYCLALVMTRLVGLVLGR